MSAKFQQLAAQLEAALNHLQLLVQQANVVLPVGPGEEEWMVRDQQHLKRSAAQLKLEEAHAKVKNLLGAAAKQWQDDKQVSPQFESVDKMKLDAFYRRLQQLEQRLPPMKRGPAGDFRYGR